MVDKEGMKDHLALRKHREKRRAKAALPPMEEGDGSNCNDKNSQTASTEVSLGDFVDISPGFTERTEMVSTIIATHSDHDRMRKISILGLEDPADSVRSTRRMDPRDSNFVVSTKPLEEQMRKVSMLGLEDPADSVSDLRHGRRARGKDRESRPSGSRQTNPRSSHNFVERHDQVKQSATIHEQEVEDSPNVRGEQEVKPTSPRPRSRSVDNDNLLLQVSRVPNRKDKKPFRTRSFDLDQSFLTVDGVDFQASARTNDFTESRIVGPKELGGVIETTKEQKNLMRKISALGMYDPVFGNIHKDLEISHASIVFEDMDFDDVPEDMRDMLGHTSEHTDPVICAPKFTTEKEKASGKEPIATPVFEPPVGSFLRRGSKRNDHPVLPPATPQQSETKKPQRALPVRHAKSERVRDSKKESFSDQVSNAYTFIPPTGSFNVRKARERSQTPTRKAILKDIELAARAQSMFANDSLLGASASNLESALHASLGSFTFDMSDHSSDSAAPLNKEVHASSKKKGRASHPLPHGGNGGVNGTSTSHRRKSAPITTKPYIPPAVLSQSPNEEGMAKQPMTPSRTGKGSSSSPRKKRNQTRHSHSSSRSWGGDSDLEDPMAHVTATATSGINPMWASLSVLDTDFPNLER